MRVVKEQGVNEEVQNVATNLSIPIRTKAYVFSQRTLKTLSKHAMAPKGIKSTREVAGAQRYQTSFNNYRRKIIKKLHLLKR